MKFLIDVIRIMISLIAVFFLMLFCIACTLFFIIAPFIVLSGENNIFIFPWLILFFVLCVFIKFDMDKMDEEEE